MRPKYINSPKISTLSSKPFPVASAIIFSPLSVCSLENGSIHLRLQELGGEWTAKQHSGDLEGSSDNTFDLQKSLVKAAFSSGDSGAVQSSFSYTSPSSAVFQVIIGGAVVGGGAAAAAPAGGAPAAEAPKEEKMPEKEASEDEDMGFSLFD